MTRKNECLIIESRLRMDRGAQHPDVRALLDLIAVLRIERNDAKREEE